MIGTTHLRSRDYSKGGHNEPTVHHRELGSDPSSIMGFGTGAKNYLRADTVDVGRQLSKDSVEAIESFVSPEEAVDHHTSYG